MQFSWCYSQMSIIIGKLGVEEIQGTLYELKNNDLKFKSRNEKE